MTKETVKQLLLTIVKALVTMPDEVSIEVANDDQFVNFNLKVASQDVGRVIGKNGTVVQAIRSLIYGIRIDDDRRIKLNVIDWLFNEPPIKQRCFVEVFLLERDKHELLPNWKNC